MNAFVFRSGLDDDINALSVVFGHDVNMGGAGAPYALAVGADVVGAGGHLVQPGHLFQQVFLYFVHLSASYFSSASARRSADQAVYCAEQKPYSGSVSTYL